MNRIHDLETTNVCISLDQSVEQTYIESVVIIICLIQCYPFASYHAQATLLALPADAISHKSQACTLCVLS